MAFNPFRSFQKNQKYWMAAILLMCMLTFVVCTGVGGDLSERILAVFNSNRARGEEVVKINGHTFYMRDLEELKTRRNIAQEYMALLMKFGIERIEYIIKEEKKPLEEQKGLAGKELESRQVRLITLERLHQDLIERSKRPRYFHTGTRLDDLTNFLLWLEIADKENIRLRNDDLADLVQKAVYSPVPIHFTSDVDYKNKETIRSNHYGARDDVILKALNDEFRVEIAKLASLECRFQQYARQNSNPDKFIFAGLPLQVRLPLSPAQIFDYYIKTRSAVDVQILPIALEELATKVRAPSESELKEFFDKYAKEKYDPTSDKPGFTLPKRVKIGYLMADPNSAPYRQATEALITLTTIPTPASIIPIGLQPLQLAVVPLAAFDASMQRDYDNLTKIGRPDWIKYYFPGWPTPSARLVYFLSRHGSLIGPNDPAMFSPIGSLLNSLKDSKEKYQPTRQTVARVVAGFGSAGISGFIPACDLAKVAVIDDQVKADEKKWAPILQIEDREQKKLGLRPWDAKVWYPGGERLVQAAQQVGLCAPPLPVPAILGAIKYDPKTTTAYQTGDGEILTTPPLGGMPSRTLEFRHMPFTGWIRDQFRQDQVEKKLAQQWANQIMLEVEKELDAAKGDDKRFPRLIIPKILNKYQGFVKEEKSGFYHKYNIGNAPELRDLRDNFDKAVFGINETEGRTGTPRQLKEDTDFYKLFFDGESFSVGTNAAFYPQVWPPRITAKRKPFETGTGKEKIVDYFKDAQRPMIFWKIAQQEEITPKSLDAVRPEVEKAWKMQEAARDILDKVKSATTDLRNAEKNKKSFELTLQQEAKKYGRPIIELKEVAPLVPNEFRGPRDPITYVPYQLPRSVALRLEYPREDTLKDLVAMTHLKEPIKLGIAKLDELNKELFDKRDQGHVIQVITNQPQTDYYILVADDPSSKFGGIYQFLMMNKFNFTLKQTHPTKGGGVLMDQFLDVCQANLGKEFHQLFLEQMAVVYQREFNTNGRDAAIRQFDTDAPQKQP